MSGEFGRVDHIIPWQIGSSPRFWWSLNDLKNYSSLPLNPTLTSLPSACTVTSFSPLKTGATIHLPLQVLNFIYISFTGGVPLPLSSMNIKRFLISWKSGFILCANPPILWGSESMAWEIHSFSPLPAFGFKQDLSTALGANAWLMYWTFSQETN